MSAAAINLRAPSTNQPNQLVRDNLPLLRQVASRMARKLPAPIEVDELVGAGALGLLDAARRFDETRGVPFPAYAEIRISGAIYDSLRRNDWLPRAVRRTTIQIDRARCRLGHNLGRAPTEDELSDHLGIDADNVREHVAIAHRARIISLSAARADRDGQPLVERLPLTSPTAEERMCADQLRKQINTAIQQLPKRERDVIHFCYIRGLNLRETGHVMGITESRACQLRKRAIDRLKFRLRAAVS